MANKMLIDATHPEETRVVVLRGNRVEEFDFETAQRKQLRGNIYLAKVTRVEPSLQAAFIDYGGNRHGFLAFSEIHPDYYQIPVADRQALIEEESRAQRDYDDSAEQRSGGRQRRGRGRDRGRQRGAERRDDTMRSAPLPDADATAFDTSAADAAGGSQGDASQDTSHDTFHDASHETPHETFGEQTHGQEHDQEHDHDERHDDHGHEHAPDHTHRDDHGDDHGDNHALAAHTHEDHTHGDDDRSRADNGPHDAEPAATAPFETREQPEGFGEHEASESAIDAAHDHADHGHAEHAHHDDVGDHDDENHDEHHEDDVVESIGGADAMEEVPEQAPRYRRQYKIQEVIKRRQIMLVQVVKEERGTKGAALTTYLSLAGRYSVLMPNTARGGGISRKITSSDDRRRLKEIAEELEVPEGMGVILRTAGANRTKTEVKRDFEYLIRLWETVRDLTLKSTAPTLVYEEGSLVKRSIRDLYGKDIDEVIVAGDDAYRDAKDFMRMLMPSHAKNVKPYKDTQPIYARYGIEAQLDAMFSPTVQLRSGGYIVINQTEALVAIDVNSGRSTREHHIEDTALKTNLESADEVARQLRLRDLAGLIVIDFIDMDEKRNNRTVERRLKDALKNDRARIQVGRISHFGLMEMSRQRIRTSVLESSTEKCPLCGGSGHVRSVSSVALQLLRTLEETMMKGATHNLVVRTRPEVALYVLNQKRGHLRALEERFLITITVQSDPDASGQVPVTIDRGEQVMTLDQAKALVAQSAAVTLVSEPEDDIVDAEQEDEDAGAEADGFDSDNSVSADGGDEEQTRHEQSHQEQPDDETARGDGEGSSRGRRRRRGRRGGRGREGGQVHDNSMQDAPAAAHGETGTHAQPTDADDDGDEDRPLAGEPYAPGMRPPSGEEGAEGDGRRRRRRGRRGGRRNRRDGDQVNGNDAVGATGEHADTYGEASVSDHPLSETPMSDASHAAATPQPHDITEDTYAPRIERADRPLTPPEPPVAVATPSEAPTRRRSTVREAAPSFDASAAAPAVPAPEPAVSPASESSTDDSAAAAKPRKTGWWSKKLLGG